MTVAEEKENLSAMLALYLIPSEDMLRPGSVFLNPQRACRL